jgi:chorismate mutase / prephenate dehydratase
MEDLSKLREDIDLIDSELVKLFEKRMETVLKVAEYKKANKMEILNSSREETVIRKAQELLKNKDFSEELARFFTSLMEGSRRIQAEYLNSSKKKVTVTVGFQGVPGSFSEQALFEYFGKKVATKNVAEFGDIFTELKNKNIDYGVLPIENSSTGGISDVYDLLNKYDFSIVGEVCLKVNHNLMGVKGAEIDDIKEVYSHSQAFGQCSDFLKNYPNWKLIPYHNTAKSAEFVNEQNNNSVAAIASEKAAEIYDLRILHKNINSNSTNTTKFVIIGREMKVDEGCDKISIVLSTAHRAGYLYNVLRNFAEKNINLLKIESRPIKDKPWEYFFHIDFEGNLNDETIDQAIEEIKKNCKYFKLLGNYKSYEGVC